MTYWKATVERPDGEGGWVVVDVFGVRDHPAPGSARHLHGDTAHDAAVLLLGHVWPVNLAAFLQAKDDVGRWAADREAKAGIADHRITVEPHSWSVNFGQPSPPAATFTVAELRLDAVRAAAAELAKAQAALKQLTAQVRRARSDIDYQKYLLTQAGEEAKRAGVDEPAVAKAGYRPRRPPKTRRATTPGPSDDGNPTRGDGH